MTCVTGHPSCSTGARVRECETWSEFPLFCNIVACLLDCTEHDVCLSDHMTQKSVPLCMRECVRVRSAGRPLSQESLLYRESAALRPITFRYPAPLAEFEMFEGLAVADESRGKIQEGSSARDYRGSALIPRALGAGCDKAADRDPGPPVRNDRAWSRLWSEINARTDKNI